MKKKEIKFSCPVSMECSEEQYERDLEQPLKELGYDYIGCFSVGHHPILCTNWGESHELGAAIKNHSFLVKTCQIPTYNPKLFLALAGCTEGEEPIVGEYIIGKGDDLDELKKVIEIDDDSRVMFKHAHYYTFDYYRKVTKEELINHFSEGMTQTEVDKMLIDFEEEDMKKESRFPFELHLSDIRNLYRGAKGCDKWMIKIERELASQLVVSDIVKVEDTWYAEARAEANEKQHKVLDEVFGKDEESVEDVLLKMLRNTTHYDQTLRVEKLLETFNIEFKK